MENEYVSHSEEVWTINFDKDNWHSSTCNCWHHKKRFHCKHVVALALRKSLVAIPDAYYGTCVIGSKPKRGRAPAAPVGRRNLLKTKKQ